MSDLAPDDDAFIRTAIRGLRAPEHHRAFWNDLGGQLDAAAEVLVAQGLLVDRSVPPLVVELPVVELPQAAPAPAPEAEPAVEEPPAPVPPEALHAPRRQPLRATPPAHAAAGAARVRAFGAQPSGGARAGTKAAPEVVVRHDPAVVPHSLRRTSNAVLLAVALVAAAVALVAGLSLVRQRADNSGSPPPVEAPEQARAAA